MFKCLKLNATKYLRATGW